MAFQQVQVLDADNVIALGGVNKKTGKKNPTQVEGYYLGAREVESRKSKDGKAKIHFFQTSKGNIGVWGKTDLDRKLSSVGAGTMVRATFSGMKPTPNGEMYSYKVEHDPENAIEVSLSDSNDSDSDSSSEDTTSNDSYEESEETSTEDDEDESISAATLAKDAAERKQRVQNLLKNKKA